MACHCPFWLELWGLGFFSHWCFSLHLHWTYVQRLLAIKDVPNIIAWQSSIGPAKYFQELRKFIKIHKFMKTKSFYKYNIGNLVMHDVLLKRIPVNDLNFSGILLAERCECWADGVGFVNVPILPNTWVNSGPSILRPLSFSQTIMKVQGNSYVENVNWGTIDSHS